MQVPGHRTEVPRQTAGHRCGNAECRCGLRFVEFQQFGRSGSRSHDTENPRPFPAFVGPESIFAQQADFGVCFYTDAIGFDRLPTADVQPFAQCQDRRQYGSRRMSQSDMRKIQAIIIVQHMSERTVGKGGQRTTGFISLADDNGLGSGVGFLDQFVDNLSG